MLPIEQARVERAAKRLGIVRAIFIDLQVKELVKLVEHCNYEGKNSHDKKTGGEFSFESRRTLNKFQYKRIYWNAQAKSS